MTPLANQKLVEAINRFKIYVVDNLADSANGGDMLAVEYIELALKEASAPQKEFAGLDHEGWQMIYMRMCSSDLFVNYPGGKEQIEAVHKIVKMLEPAACRQIAEGLSE